MIPIALAVLWVSIWVYLLWQVINQRRRMTTCYRIAVSVLVVILLASCAHKTMIENSETVQLPDTNLAYTAVTVKAGSHSYETLGVLLLQCYVQEGRPGVKKIEYRYNYRSEQWEGSESPEQTRLDDCTIVQVLQEGGPGLAPLAINALVTLGAASMFPVGLAVRKPDVTTVQQTGGGASATAEGGEAVSVNDNRSSSQSTSRSTAQSESTSRAQSDSRSQANPDITVRTTNTNTNTNRLRPQQARRIQNNTTTINWMDGR